MACGDAGSGCELCGVAGGFAGLDEGGRCAALYFPQVRKERIGCDDGKTDTLQLQRHQTFGLGHRIDDLEQEGCTEWLVRRGSIGYLSIGTRLHVERAVWKQYKQSFGGSETTLRVHGTQLQ